VVLVLSGFEIDERPSEYHVTAVQRGSEESVIEKEEGS
jgi:hypothetical protein